MSTPTYYGEDPPAGISTNFPESFGNQSQLSISPEIYHPNFSSPFVNPLVKQSVLGFQATDSSSENQYITGNQTPMLAFNNPPSLDEKYPSTMSKDDLIEMFTKIASSRFPSAHLPRIQALFTKTFEAIEKENDNSTRQSSQSEYQLTSSESRDLYSSLESEYLLAPENSCSSSGYG